MMSGIGSSDIMKKSKKIVITNHTDKFVEWYDLLLKHGYAKDDIIIYDRDHAGFNGENLDPKRFEEYGTVIKTPNVGANIYVIGKYVVDNYENLPDLVLFIKCNIIQKKCPSTDIPWYTTQETFERALDAEYFFPIEADSTNNVFPTRFFVNDRIFVEDVKDIPTVRPNSKIYPRISSFPDFINDLFVIDKMPDYVLFCPGANYVIPKECILKYSKNFYKKMMAYTDYENSNLGVGHCEESHWFERVLELAWQGNLKENFSYIVE